MVGVRLLLSRGEVVFQNGLFHVSVGLTRRLFEGLSEENQKSIWAALDFTSLPPLAGIARYENAFFLNTGEHGRPLDVILTLAEIMDETRDDTLDVPVIVEPPLVVDEVPIVLQPDPQAPIVFEVDATGTGVEAALRLEVVSLNNEMQRMVQEHFYERDLERQAAADALAACRLSATAEPLSITLPEDFRPQGADILGLPDFDITPVIDWVKDWFKDGVQESQQLYDEPVQHMLGEFIQQMTVGEIKTTAEFQAGATKFISDQLKKVLELANVNRSDFPSGAVEGTIEAELLIFEHDAARAIDGAAVATTLVLTLNIIAAAADGATQVASLGQIQGFQQLVQNLIWATGLSDVGGLTFRPQVATSFAPLLQRYWHSQSQAMLPGQGDIQRFLVREIFDPTRRAELLGTEDLSQIKQVNRQLGFSDYWTENYWAAHWNLMSQGQLDEALHRGIIDDVEWRRQVRFNDVVPESVDWLEKIIYKPFTRVDVRRMESRGLLTEEQTLKAYTDVGYFAPMVSDGQGGQRPEMVLGGDFDPSVHKAQAMVIFTKVFNAIPNIRRRLSKGNLRPEDVLKELTDTGLPVENAELLRDGLVKAEDLDTAEATRELTTAQIIRGAKRGLISFVQARFLLEDLGWRSERADFLLRLQTSPEDAPTATTLGQRLTPDSPIPVDIMDEDI